MGENRPAKILSCANCRQRKVKCDKIQPSCTQCSRAGLSCVFPSRKPTRRAPRPRQNELLDRLSRLENIVGQVDPSRLQQLDEETAGARVQRKSNAGSFSGDAEPTDKVPASQDSTQGGAEDAGVVAGRYLSSGFWKNLCTEVEGLKKALDQPSDDDDDEDEEGFSGDSPESVETTNASSASSKSSSFMLGNPEHRPVAMLTHPSTGAIVRLWSIYTRNVDPLIKILHRPTVEKQLQELANSTSKTCDASTTALFFVIYFAAVVSLRPEDCIEELGQSKDVIAGMYRSWAEQALAEADYLNSNELQTLQAFTLYTTVLRTHMLNRSSWALTSLLVRLAMAQGLHRDSSGRRFTPYIAEMRRRLWHFVVVLDIRASEDRGSDAILARSSWNTAIPTAIDDCDFGPDMTGPLVPKPTPAENVICLCTAMCSSIFGYISHPHTNAEGQAENFVYTEDQIITHIRRLESSFIHTAEPGNIPSLYASEIARLVILKLWLNIQYPFTTHASSVERPRVSRETMPRTAVSIMELRERMKMGDFYHRFAWWTDTYVQWHPLAVALADLCVQPEGELADRAWVVIDRVFPDSRAHIADTARGSLWKPIKRLLKRAKQARAEAMMKNLAIQESTQQTSPAVQEVLSHFQSEQSLLDNTMSNPVPQQQPFDSVEMNLSYLFEYPTELLRTDFDMNNLSQVIPMEWSLWNEFLMETQVDNSPGDR